MLRVACRRLSRMLQQWDETRPTCGYQACGYAGSKSHSRKRVGRVRVRSGFMWAKCHQSLGSFVTCVSIFVAVIVWDLCFRLTLTSQACEHAVTGTGHLADGDVSCRMLSPLAGACMLQTRQPGRCRHSPLRFLPSSSWCRRVVRSCLCASGSFVVPELLPSQALQFHAHLGCRCLPLCPVQFFGRHLAVAPASSPFSLCCWPWCSRVILEYS